MTDEAPKAQLADTLTAYEGRAYSRVNILPTSLQEKVIRGRELRELRNEGMETKDMLQEMRKSRDTVMTQAQIKDMLSQFGAGATKIDGKEVKFDDTKVETNPQKLLIEASYKQGETLIKGIGSYLQYSEVAQEAFKTGKGLFETYKAMYGDNPSEWRALRENALDALINTGIYERIEPEFKNLSKMDQREFIERFLASDSRLAKYVTKEMTRIETELNKLPSIEGSGKYSAAKSAKEEADKQVEASVTEYISQATALGFDLPKDFVEEQLKIHGEQSRAIKAIKEKILSANPDLKKFADYRDAEAKYKQAEANFERFEDGKAPLTIRNKLIDADTELKTARTLFDGLSDAAKDAGFAKLDDMNKVLDTASEQGKHFQAAWNAKRLSVEHEKEMNKAKVTNGVDELKNTNQRLRGEAERAEDLENVLYNAILDTLSDRLEDVNVGLSEEQKKKKKEDEEKMETEQKEAEHKVKEGIEKNWIRREIGKRRRHIDRDRIADDIRMITYEGDVGVKRLMLRDMGRADYKTVDLETGLDENTKKYLDHVYKEEGDKYSETLLKSFFIARGRRDNSPRGKLGLRDYEKVLLEKNFGAKIDTALAGSKEAQQILQKWIDRGFKSPQALKWLLYTLLGGAAVAGLAATAPVVAPAVGAMGVKGILGKAGEGTAHAASAVWNGKR